LVKWRAPKPDDDGYLSGPYPIMPTNVWDCALRFTADMYRAGQTQCLSFTGSYKHLKLGKGGAILTDSREDYEWYKRARFSGRREVSYHDDTFDMIGWNFYMLPSIAAQGLLLMGQFLRPDGSRQVNADLSIRFPDLSRFPVYTQAQMVSPEQAQAEVQRAMAQWDAIDFASVDKLGSGLPRDEMADVLRGYVGGTRPHIGAQSASVTFEPNAETISAIEDSRAEIGDVVALGEIHPDSAWLTEDWGVAGGYEVGVRLLLSSKEGAEDSAKRLRKAIGKIKGGLSFMGDLVNVREVCCHDAAPIRAVVDPEREPWPGYHEFRGMP
jgi:hypothetical protein